MKLFLLTLIMTTASPNGGGGGAQAEVDALIADALSKHPALAASAARVDALRHSVDQHGVWPDPVVAVEYSNMPVLAPWPGNHPMSGVQFKLTQKLPFPTKLPARVEAARAKLDAAAPLEHETTNDIIGRIKTLVVSWRLAAILRDVTERHVQSAERLLDVVRIKYELGRVQQHELVRLEVLRDRLENDVIDLQRRQDIAAAALNTLAQRTPGSSLSLGDKIYIRQSDPAGVDALVEEAKGKRPLFAAARATVEAARIKAGALRTEKWPDLTTWAGYRVRLPAGQDPGDNFITAGVAVPIPWASASGKWEEKALEHEAKARAEEARRRALELKLREELETALIRHRRARQRAIAYETRLIPGARKTLESAFASYQVDRAGFGELFAAEQTALEYERVAVKSRAEAAVAEINIDTLVGRHVVDVDGAGVHQ